MIYTYKQGVDRQLKQRVIRGGGLGLPIVSLIFLVVAVLSFSAHHSSGQSPNIPTPPQPKVSSVLKAKTPNANNKKTNTGQEQSGNSSEISLGSGEPAMSFGSLSSPVSEPVISVPPAAGTSGGLGGGGDITPGGGSLPSGSGGGTSSPPAPTLVCTNLLSLAQVCTACTPPLTLQPGQKALLSSDGTCTSVN